MKISWLKIFLIIIVVIIALLAMLPVFINPIAQRIVEQNVYPLFKNRLKVGSIDISFLRGMVELKDTELQQPPGFSDGDLLQCKSVKVWIALFPLLRNHLLLRQVIITDPEVTVIQTKHNTVNTDYIISGKAEEHHKEPTVKNELPAPPVPSSPAPPDTSDSSAKAFTIHLNSLTIINAAITQYNYKIRSKLPTLLISDLNVKINNFDFPNNSDTKTLFNFNGNFSSTEGPKAPVTCNGEGVFLTKALSLNAKNVIENLSLPAFAYFMPQSQVTVKSGNAWVTSNIKIKENYLNSTHHVEVKNLKISGSKGGLSGKTFFDLPAAGLMKVLETTNGGLEFDFNVKGYLNNLRFKLREEIITEITSSIGKKAGEITGNALSSVEKVKDLGSKAKDSLKQMFKFK